MSDLRLDLDIRELESLAKDLEALDDDLQRSAQLLAGQAHLHILEQAQTKLHSRREMYVKALAKPTEIMPGVWMITLKEDAVWVEEGMPPHSMVKDLLGDNPHVAKDGSRYRVIPFEHSKGGVTQTTPAEQELVKAIKGELKKLRIPWSTVERNADGSPKSGVLHKLDIGGPPRPAGTEAGPDGNQHGYGHGPIGAPMQGPTGIPFLKGVRISQSPMFNPDGTPKMNKKGQQMAQRNITTFRIVSSKHEGSRWQYPGIEGTRFLDEALQWAETTWEQKMLPELLKKYGAE